jgi:quinoprotein dehydrogenase-associated probable ABC transporter substrate-binding protein
MCSACLDRRRVAGARHLARLLVLASLLFASCQGSLVLADAASAATTGTTASTSAPAPEPRVLRVAADPNNLPFSNERLEGFENRIAELIAAELGARLEYQWWPQRRGFFRETVGAGRADLVLGVPAGFERVLTTRPYYVSTYVFVQKVDDPPLRSVDDPALEHLRIGVQLAGDDGNNTPPAHALSRRGLVENIRGYTLFGDYAQDSPPSAIVAAVASGEVDVAVAWGPMAGYFAARQTPPLAVTPLDPCNCPDLPFTFAIAVGVARARPELRDEVDAILARRADDIARILDAYRVPRVAPNVPDRTAPALTSAATDSPPRKEPRHASP